MPNDRRAATRRQTLETGTIEVADVIHQKLSAAVGGNQPAHP
jgi:hypothetical protein